MTTVAKLIAELGVDATKFKQALKEAEKDFDAYSTKVRNAAKESIKVNGGLTASEKQLADSIDKVSAAQRAAENATRRVEKVKRDEEQVKRRLVAVNKAIVDVDRSDKAAKAKLIVLDEKRQRLLARQKDLSESAKNASNAEATALERVTRAKLSAVTKMIEAERKFTEAQKKESEQRIKQLNREFAQQNAKHNAYVKNNIKLEKEVTAEVNRELNRRQALRDREWKEKDKEFLKAERLAEKAANLGQKVSVMSGINSMYKGLSHLHTYMSQTASAVTTSISLPVAAMGTAFFNSAVEIERTQKQLEVAMGSAKLATEEFQKLVEVSEKPGLELKGLIRGSVGLQTIGHDANTARFILEQFGNELGKVGGTAEEFDRVAMNLQQISSMKFLVGQEILQMSRLVPTLRKALIDLYGTAEGKELEKLGLTGKQTVLDLAGYFSKTARAGDSTANTIKNLKNQMTIIASTVGKEIIPVFKEMVDILLPKFKEYTKAFSDLSPEVKKNVVQFGALLAVAGPTLYIFTGLVGVFRGAVGVIGFLTKSFLVLRGAILVTQGALTTAQLGSTFTSIGVASTAAAGATTAAWAVALLPFIKVAAVVAAVALAIYGLKKAWDWAVNYGVKSEEQIKKETTENLKLVVAEQKRKETVVDLIKEYQNLQVQTGSNEEVSARLKEVYLKIAEIAPELVAGFDSQGRAILRLKSKYEDVTKAARDSAEAARQAAFALEFGERHRTLSDEITTIREKIQGASSGTLSGAIKAGLDVGRYTSDRGYGFGTNSSAEATKTLAKLNSQLLSKEKEMAELKKQMKLSSDAGKGIVPEAKKQQNEALDARDKELKALRDKVAELKKVADAEKKARAETKATTAVTKSAEQSLRDWKREAKSLASQFGLKVTSEFRPGARTRGSGSVSYHARSIGKERGMALDIAGSKEKMGAFFDYMKQFHSKDIVEMLYSPKGKVQNGKFSPHINNDITRKDHYDHVHLVMKTMRGVRTEAVAISEEMKTQIAYQEKIQDIYKSQKDEQANLLLELKPYEEHMKFVLMSQQEVAKARQEAGGNIPQEVVNEIMRTVELRRQLEVLNKHREIRKNINALHLEQQMMALSPRTRAVQEAFGVDLWRDRDTTQEQKDAFSKLFFENYDREQMQNALQGMRDIRKELVSYTKDISGSGFVSKTEETEKAISELFNTIENKSLKARANFAIFATLLRNLAKQADAAYGSKLFKELNDPFDRFKSDQENPLSSRDFALRDFVESNKETFATFAKLDAMFGSSLGADSKSNFLKDFDLKETLKVTNEYNQALGSLKNTIWGMNQTSSFDAWLVSQRQWDEQLQKYVLPEYLKDTAKAKVIFDAEFRVEQLQSQRDLFNDIALQIYRLEAKNPFEAWKRSLMEIDQQGNIVDEIGLSDEALKNIFLLNEWMTAAETFSEGIKSLFSDMIYDISENGFKNLFSSIYNGFQNLLFKMAVEYLSSLIYREVLGFAGGLLGSFGGSSGKGGGGVLSIFPDTLASVGAPSDGFLSASSVSNEIMAVAKSSMSDSLPSFGGSSYIKSLNSSSSVYDNSSQYGGSSLVKNSSSNHAGNTVIVINNYYGSNGGGNAEKRTQSQIMLDAQRQATQVLERLS